ncbi:hypothetical protein [Bosea massiliensis]|uniref:YCII-related domain-containing protein n=1 Tax=Bosea massiliensis TaxID=151419 RepID=A0ABW0P9A8_9HYPH
MKLFAHIQDLSGLADGVQGLVLGFAAVAETDDEAETFAMAGITFARSEPELAELLGPEAWPYYVPAPNAQCAGWRYEAGQFIDP